MNFAFFSKCENRPEGVFGVLRVQTHAQRVSRRNFGANGCETSEMEQIDGDIPKSDDLLPKILENRPISDLRLDPGLMYSSIVM